MDKRAGRPSCAAADGRSLRCQARSYAVLFTPLDCPACRTGSVKRRRTAKRRSLHAWPLLWPLFSTLVGAAELDDVSRDMALEQQRLRQTLEQHHQQQRTYPQLTGPGSGPAPAQPVADEACWKVPGVRVAGVTLISPKLIDARVQAWAAPCMGPNRINGLLAALTQLFVDAGFIASRPLLAAPPQAGQSLDILVEEGFVESIELAGEALDLSLQGAFPGMVGAPLNLRDLEQGLEQLNRLRWLDLTADVAPGDLPGGSRIILRQASIQPRWSAQIGLDNAGSELTGRARYLLAGGIDSPLGLNDALSASFSATPGQAPQGSRSFGLYYALPYGHWKFNLFGGWADSRYDVKVWRRALAVSSDTQYYALGVERLLWRRQNWQLNADAQLVRKVTRTDIAGYPSAIQSSSLTLFQAGLNLYWLAQGSWNLNLGYVQGLDWLGADRDEELPRWNYRQQPHSQFRLWRSSLSHGRRGEWSLPWGRQTWQWDSQWAAQYSAQPLAVAEQMVVGADYNVRGFTLNSTAGAIGMSWRNQLRLPLARLGPVQLTPRLGLDTGWSKLRHREPGRRLTGMALGLAANWQPVQVDIEYQRALHQQRLPLDEPAIWLMRLSWQL